MHVAVAAAQRPKWEFSTEKNLLALCRRGRAMVQVGTLESKNLTCALLSALRNGPSENSRTEKTYLRVAVVAARWSKRQFSTGKILLARCRRGRATAQVKISEQKNLTCALPSPSRNSPHENSRPKILLARCRGRCATAQVKFSNEKKVACALPSPPRNNPTKNFQLKTRNKMSCTLTVASRSRFTTLRFFRLC